MHGGAHVVVAAAHSGASYEVVASYSGHGSIAYGADWARGQSDDDDTAAAGVVVSCSFYDRGLDVWRAPPAAMATLT